MKSAVRNIGGVVLIVGALVVIVKLNAMFGYRKGEIDMGRWYVMKSSDGYTWLEKGIDPGNPFVDADQIQSQFEKFPNYVKTVRGYGAAYTDIGWLGDAYLSSSGWHLFSSEREAVEFLKTNGVADNWILYAYK